jgi:anti-anti-sigma regulatory factor
MAFIINRSRDGKTVILNVNGRFDISQGFALWQYCQPEEYHYQKYVFNLSGVNDLRDSGLAWLRMFVNWAHREEAVVRVIIRPEIKEDFIAAGLDVEYTASSEAGADN